jgi:hypothetical protein
MEKGPHPSAKATHFTEVEGGRWIPLKLGTPTKVAAVLYSDGTIHDFVTNSYRAYPFGHLMPEEL